MGLVAITLEALHNASVRLQASFSQVVQEVNHIVVILQTQDSHSTLMTDQHKHNSPKITAKERLQSLHLVSQGFNQTTSSVQTGLFFLPLDPGPLYSKIPGCRLPNIYDHRCLRSMYLKASRPESSSTISYLQAASRCNFCEESSKPRQIMVKECFTFFKVKILLKYSNIQSEVFFFTSPHPKVKLAMGNSVCWHIQHFQYTTPAMNYASITSVPSFSFVFQTSQCWRSC